MESSLVQELFNRRAVFALLNPMNPFSSTHPTKVEVPLSSEEAKELKRISFERDIKELSERRCNSCLTGLIVKQLTTDAMRYSCTCDGSQPINQEDWMPLSELVPI
jgi:hypothetical protein